MRHHGAPTRLLDWTYSFFVAVFFAIAELECKSEVGVVWALNTKGLPNLKEVKRKIKRAAKSSNNLIDSWKNLTKRSKTQWDPLFLKGDNPMDNTIVTWLLRYKKMLLVYPVNPLSLNRRLTAQQGIFLFPGDIRQSFAKNLSSCEKFGSDSKNLYKIVINVCVDQRNEILSQLRSMNIYEAVLFPDLDGFAKSMRQEFAYPEIFPKIFPKGK